jgi:hypothetical protein
MFIICEIISENPIIDIPINELIHSFIKPIILVAIKTV